MFSKFSGSACSQYLPTRQSVIHGNLSFRYVPLTRNWTHLPVQWMDAIELSYQLESFEEMAQNNSITVKMCSCNHLEMAKYKHQIFSEVCGCYYKLFLFLLMQMLYLVAVGLLLTIDLLTCAHSQGT